MNKAIIIAAVSLSIASVACAQAIELGKPDVKLAAPGAYTLDKGHANVVFSVNHLGYSGYIGRFNGLDASLQFDPKNPEKSELSVTIDAASIDTNHAELEQKLRSDAFFNVEKHPKITFKSTKITQKSAIAGLVTGDLTLLGVTKEVSLATRFNGAGVNPFSKKPVLGFSATAKIKRSDFGLSAYVPAVGDEVSLTIEAEFQQ
jgi:polyisoprenoid-binding protein YceI